MRFRDDRRAAALQVGAILLLGFLVIGLALYQSTVVPDQNKRVEFDHNQQVQGSLQDVRNGILRTASAERTSPTAVPLGTRYPTRIVAVNPPPSSGSLRTEPGGKVSIVNATAVDGETADFWNGSNRSYATQRLSYRPDYSLYQNAPRTAYADTVLYNGFDDDRNRAVTDQQLLSGNLIYVVALNGSYSRSGTQAATISPSPVSASDRTVAVNGSDIEIKVTTDLSESEWERLLADQYESNGGRIDGNADGVTVYPSNETLVVDLVSNRTYRLRMAKVGVGTGVTDTTEQYLTVVDGADSVTAGGTRRIVLEVRDGYNNPVSGVPVEAAVDGEGSIRPTTGASDGQGRVVYEYGAPDSLSSARDDSINFSFKRPVDRPDFSGEEPESVRINVTVVPLGNVGDIPGGTTYVYPDEFDDAVDGNEAFENSDVPPDDPAGDIDDFENMQAANGQTASLTTSGSDLNVGTVTRNVGSTSTYELDIGYESNKAGKVDVRIVDDDDTVLQTIPLTDFNDGPVTLNGAATDEVSNTGTLYVRYERTGPGGDSVTVDVDYQRLVVG
ncbi:Ig-like domain-containing protein [Haloplanus ruber]|uniref:Ig-like domain-containing protein n=1 Tax=Haloplanus ruber TaxID=869892 RepID=A0ABD6CXB0_9EURY|nr:Ig-like domain-containing protein [Haloplanus ruber]